MDQFKSTNVFGSALQPCGQDPVTGFYRDGCCNTGHADGGMHTVCAIVTEAFLSFSRSRGNDLTAPVPFADFPGLKPGDRWCLCAGRWLEAHRAGVAPLVDLAATHEETLAVIGFETLAAHAVAGDDHD
ncbi:MULTISPECIES: DUF2237 family protein [Spiribacter]|jgi:uncharacterized protein (DUF2237 family)|uniref:DUF2237 domain-containing protein n=2 Tax=Spiribacter TaxID=1335745 RepID=A0A557RFH9_9GAMM|nr:MULTISPECIES: DUF2237 domain-containing protein [Spiribacter]PZA00455.1 DUF2237 domain-containing protein [Gammaproteobacteria bacterium 2W06]AUB78519.1 hypothetical protein BBH56_05020 [Spiribacter roseus]KAF0280479.1 hypothetical protein BA897_07295 [Spiribacter roseus]KAF0282776.1 hypothetical protein BA900_00780 [Spiribacter roseus]KAF0284088.1 hypothetical protein BA898_06920 [Spiribacter roseus]